MFSSTDSINLLLLSFINQRVKEKYLSYNPKKKKMKKKRKEKKKVHPFLLWMG